MILELHFVLVLALIWGALWAGTLQFTKLGRYLVRDETWITVVIGVGVDLGLLALYLPSDEMVPIVAVFAASSLCVILRSLTNKRREIDDEPTPRERRVAMKRLANNVISALEDIIALSIELRAMCREGLNDGEEKGVVRWARALDRATTIERKAAGARAGEYRE